MLKFYSEGRSLDLVFRVKTSLDRIRTWCCGTCTSFQDISCGQLSTSTSEARHAVAELPGTNISRRNIGIRPQRAIIRFFVCHCIEWYCNFFEYLSDTIRHITNNYNQYTSSLLIYWSYRDILFLLLSIILSIIVYYSHDYFVLFHTQVDKVFICWWHNL